MTWQEKEARNHFKSRKTWPLKLSTYHEADNEQAKLAAKFPRSFVFRANQNGDCLWVSPWSLKKTLIYFSTRKT